MAATRMKTNNASTEYVKFMVTTSIGCICFLRELFPEDAFKKAVYFVPSDKSPEEISAKEINGQSLNVTTLKSGVYAEVDKLLDWLNKDIFPTIDNNMLAYFSMDIICGAQAVESYLFDIEPLDVPRRKVNLAEETIYRKQIQRILKGTILTTQSLGMLPKQRSVRFRLLLHKNQVPERLKYFKPNDKTLYEAPIKQNSSDCGTLCTKCHKANITVFASGNKGKYFSSRNDNNPFDFATFNEDTKRNLEPVIPSQENVQVESFCGKNCECGAKKISAFSSSFLFCNSCGRRCHKVCYYQKLTAFVDTFTCLTCEAQQTNATVVKDVAKVLGLRKLYHYFTSSSSLPVTFSDIYEALGLSFQDQVEKDLFHDILVELFRAKVLILCKRRSAMHLTNDIFDFFTAEAFKSVNENAISIEINIPKGARRWITCSLMIETEPEQQKQLFFNNYKLFEIDTKPHHNSSYFETILNSKSPEMEATQYYSTGYDVSENSVFSYNAPVTDNSTLEYYGHSFK